MATSVQPLYNAKLQNDLSGRDTLGAQHGIFDLDAVGAIAGSTVYVDPSIPVERGLRGTTAPFKDLGSALQAANPGDTIILRAGAYIVDDMIPVNRAGVKIIGYGARFSSTLPNAGPMLLVLGGNVTIEGIAFDGGRAVDAVDTIEGCIRVSRAPNLTLRNLTFDDFVGWAIEMFDGFDGAIIEGCKVNNCARGIDAKLTEAQDVTGLEIHNNVISNCRKGGIQVSGLVVEFVSANVIGNIAITGNTLVNNEAALTDYPAIEVAGGSIDVLVQGNFVFGNHRGIKLNKCTRGLVSGNSVRAGVTYGIGLDGCQQIKVTGNHIDGKSGSGNVVSGMAISIFGGYFSTNDAQDFQITDNFISGLDAPGYGVNLANADNVLIETNSFMGAFCTIHAAEFQGLQIQGNRFSWGGNSGEPVILLDAGARGWVGAVIIGNDFAQSGTIDSLIRLVDDDANGMDRLLIQNNHSTVGKSYPNEIYDVASGAVTNATVKGNTPVATNRFAGVLIGTNGWANDEDISNHADQFNVNSGSATGYMFAGTKVVGARVTGFAADTGTADKTAHATYTSPNISGTYVEAEVQAIADALQNVSRGQKALKDVMIAHGLVGT